MGGELKMSGLLQWSEEARTARDEGRPLVALESTVIAHGLPHPDNLEVTAAMMAAVREAGATPALIAIDGGRLVVGAGEELLQRLARSVEVTKTNLGNLAVVLGRGGLGATTVAGTLRVAALAGIRVFATGGIGGRHRPLPSSQHDVSSDLEALRIFPCITVSAGVKSILDVAGTREELETRGVPVIGYRTNFMPLFFSPPGHTGLDSRIETPTEAARVARLHWATGGGGLLLTVPCPENLAIPAEELEPLMEEIEHAMPADIAGTRGATPWVLSRLDQATGGRTRAANKALLVQNARVAAQVAFALRGDSEPRHSLPTLNP